MTSSLLDHESLMRSCLDPSDGLTKAIAGTLAAAAAGTIQAPDQALGLDRKRFSALLARFFPTLSEGRCPIGCEGCRPLRNEEFDDLVSLLLEHRSHPGEEVDWLAHAIASACMGGNHLYQDMGLPNRQALSSLLQRYFAPLFEKNSGNMKWKKFFYKQLCDQAQVKVCQAPSCQVCDDFTNCFGPEDVSFPLQLAIAAGRVPAREEA